MVTKWCLWVIASFRVLLSIIEFRLSPQRQNILSHQTIIIWEGLELTSVAKNSTSMMEASTQVTSKPRNYKNSSKRARKLGGSLVRYSTILAKRTSLTLTRILGQWMFICLWSPVIRIASEPGKNQKRPRITFPSSTNSNRIAKYQDPWTNHPTPMLKTTKASCTSNAKTT